MHTKKRRIIEINSTINKIIAYVLKIINELIKSIIFLGGFNNLPYICTRKVINILNMFN